MAGADDVEGAESVTSSFATTGAVEGNAVAMIAALPPEHTGLGHHADGRVVVGGEKRRLRRVTARTRNQTAALRKALVGCW